MNKKFLSAILFGALMVTSTGTFVSCKDYDEDIDAINSELTTIKSQIAALQSKVDAGNYVTGVTKSAEGITFTFSNGSPVVVAVKDGAQGAAGKDGSIVEVKEGVLYINGEATEIKVAKDAACAVKIENGEWVALQEDGSYLSTGIPASGVTAVKNADKTWTLTVYNAAGEEQVIKLPTAASLISEVETLGYLYESVYSSTTDGYWYPVADGISGSLANTKEVNYNFSIVGDLNDDQKAWNKEEGVKTLTKGQALSTLASWNSNLMIRIAPADLDASEFSFSLVNSQMKEAPIVLGAPEAYDGLLTRSAVTGNGLWKLPVSTVEGKTYKNEAAYEAEFKVKGANTDSEGRIAFALKEEGGFSTNYDVVFNRNTNLSLTTGVNYCYYPELNEEISITFDSPECVYDAHLHFAEADVIRWGIVYNGGTSFTVTKLADQITTTCFYPTVHYVTLDGKVHAEEVIVKPETATTGLVLDANTILVNANNSKNKFSEGLAPMFESLGSTATTLWRADVKSYSAELYRVKTDGEKYDARIAATSTSGAGTINVGGQINVGFDKTTFAQLNNVVVSLDANNTLDRFAEYYVVLSFYANSGTLSQVKVPFNITIPALTDLLKGEQVVFNGTANGTGVMNEYDLAADGGASTYSLKYAFTNKLADAYKNNTAITFAVASNQTIKIDGNDVNVASNLVKVTNGTNKDAKIELLNYGGYKTPMYNTAINMVISSASYLNKYAYTKDERAAAAFTMTIVSPIEQGTLSPAAGANATINVVATEDGTAKVTEADLAAKTYAGIAYHVFKDAEFTNGVATEWTSPYINVDPIFESTNTNVFTVGSVNAATKDADGNVTGGYVVIKPMNVAHEDAVPVKVTVTDAWGYKKVVTINVKVSPKK